MQNILQRRLTDLHQINKSVNDDVRTRIKIDDGIFAAKIEKVVDYVLKNRDFKMIMLAGPSGSGKTTTAKMLEAEILKNGINAAVVSLDHFFVRDETTPRYADGSYNYECVHALDLPAVQKSLNELITTGTCKIPNFSFKTKGRVGEIDIDVSGGIAIIEGIHALNPLICENLSAKNLFKIFVSVESAIFEDDELVLSPREMRLIRRAIRDFNFRHASAELTLSMWPGVVNGEKQYIYPHKGTADVDLNSMHSYEPCVFAREVIKLFGGVESGKTGYDLAQKIVSAMQKFSQIDEKMLPKTSLLREFTGDGIFKY